MSERIRGSAPLEYFSLVAENLVEKYTNCAHYKGKEAHDSLTMKWMLRWLTSKDWKFSNLIGTMKAASTFGKKYSALWNSLLQINITASLYYLKMPVLVLQGAEELYVLPEQMEKIASEIPAMTYIKYSYCGHIPTAEAFPEMLAQIPEPQDLICDGIVIILVVGLLEELLLQLPQPGIDDLWREYRLPQAMHQAPY